MTGEWQSEVGSRAGQGRDRDGEEIRARRKGEAMEEGGGSDTAQGVATKRILTQG